VKEEQRASFKALESLLNHTTAPPPCPLDTATPLPHGDAARGKALVQYIVYIGLQGKARSPRFFVFVVSFPTFK
jgi:hypothetical protein